MVNKTMPPRTPAHDVTVDLLVVGSGTGMAAALAAHELGLSVVIAEKTAHVGGSTARSGGAFWIPGSSILPDQGAQALAEAGTYVRSVVGDSAPAERGQAFLDNGPAAVAMLERTTPMRFFWAEAIRTTTPSSPAAARKAAPANAVRSTPPSSARNGPGCGPASWRRRCRCRSPAPTTSG